MTHQAEFLARGIETYKPEIIARWLDRLQRDVAREGRKVELTDLRNAVGDYLSRLADSLRADQNPLAGGTAAWKDVAREHALTRVRLGFDIDELAHEFIVLRRTIDQVLREHGEIPEGRWAATLADLIDAAIATSVRTYIESRDYQVRRQEAEHIGFVTHELRNPLTTASLAATQLLRETPPGSHEGRLLELMCRNLDRIKELIEKVLLTGKLDVGEVNPRPADLTLGPLMEDGLRAAREQARQKGIAFNTTCDPALTVYADASLTLSALQNLADNAVKFTDEGEVTVVVEARGAEVMIHVRDTCSGLSSQELRTVFDPFRRAHSGKPGTGLGLAIARQSVAAQGGSIDAESNEERGCHFWFTLPRAAVS